VGRAVIVRDAIVTLGGLLVLGGVTAYSVHLGHDGPVVIAFGVSVGVLVGHYFGKRNKEKGS